MSFTLMHNSNTSGPARQEALADLLRSKYGSMEEVGRRMGIRGTNVTRLLANDRIPTYRWRQFVELGVPEDLLPDHGYNKPGPKPRAD